MLVLSILLWSFGGASAADAQGTATHQANALDGVALSAVGPPLTALNTKIADPDWLVAWLLAPSRVRPGTNMPDFGPSIAEAQAIARYLLAHDGHLAATHEQAPPSGDAGVGAKLFVARGCRGCHALDPGEASVSRRVPNLAGIGLKVRTKWLHDWLRSPRSYDSNTPMPQLVLSEDEIRHLVAFLLSKREGADVVAAAPRFDAAADVAAGRAALELYECASCHEIEGFPPPAPPFELVAEGTSGGTEIALRNGRTLVAYYNCRGCHEIEGRGGAIAAHLERKTFAPPTLDGEGARVQTSWLTEFLQRPATLRPWLKIRMPDYGLSEARARALARYFAALAAVPASDEPRPVASEAVEARGLGRFAHFKCVQCHPTSPAPGLPEGADPEDLSINLTLAKTRLRPSWIRDFLARPKAIVGTQTRMPTVFYTVDGRPKVEHPDRDIEAISAYLLSITESPEATLARTEAAEKKAGESERVDWTTYNY